MFDSIYIYILAIVIGLIGLLIFFIIGHRHPAWALFMAIVSCVLILCGLTGIGLWHDRRTEPQFCPVLGQQLESPNLPLASLTPERALELAWNLPRLVYSGQMSLNQYVVRPFRPFARVWLSDNADLFLISFIYNDIGEEGLTDDDQFVYAFSLPGDERIHVIETNPVSGSRFHVYKDAPGPEYKTTSVKNLQKKQLFAENLRAIALYLLEQELAAKAKK